MEGWVAKGRGKFGSIALWPGSLMVAHDNKN